MALAVRLRRLLLVGRSAARGLRLTTGAAGSRGQRVPWRLAASEVMGNSGTFRRSLLFSALSYLGFETCRVISQAVVVHATAKVFKIDEILEQADYLYESGETEKLYQLLTQYKESEDAELLWRLARASRDVAQLSGTSEEEKKVLVYEALEYAKRALEKNESSFAAHKWYAICISDVGDYEGIKAKIANAYIIKEHFEKAIELNPKDATSIHLMGIWCYTFAEMPWYQRRIAKVLFATPPSSTYEEALGYFHRAEQAAAAAKSLQSCPALCDPMDGGPPGSPVPGILQARTLEKDVFEATQQKARCFLANKSQGPPSAHRGG